MHNALREPSLEEIYADTTFHLVLARDGLCVEDVRAVVRQARATLNGSSGVTPTVE